MPFPLSCRGRIPVAEPITTRAIFHRLEQELRVRGAREIRRSENELYFGQVSLDRGNLDLFTPISSGRLVLVNTSEGNVLEFDVSLLRAVIITTWIWLVVGILLSVGGVRGMFDVAVLAGVWLASNLFSYFSTAARFREFLERGLYALSALPRGPSAPR